jgi:hypothetical protein
MRDASPGGFVSLRASVPTILVLGVLVLVATPLVPATAPGLDAPTLGVRAVEGHTTFAMLGSAALLGGPVVPHAEGAPMHTTVSSTLSPPPSGPVARHDYFPGVRWTNDQFLVDPVNNVINGPGPVHTNVQFATAVALLAGDAGTTPCTGTAFLVPHGAADPRGLALRYQDSTLVTDPNDIQWTTDSWLAPDGSHVWSVAVQCAVTDSALAQGAAYPGRDGLAPTGFRYSALAFLMLDPGAVAPAGALGHTASTDGALDGNSHPFDPYAGAPGRVAYEPHGTSDATATLDHHATYSLDAYYQADALVPPVRNQRVLDTEGSAAPFG